MLGIVEPAALEDGEITSTSLAVACRPKTAVIFSGSSTQVGTSYPRTLM